MSKETYDWFWMFILTDHNWKWNLVSQTLWPAKSSKSMGGNYCSKLLPRCKTSIPKYASEKNKSRMCLQTSVSQRHPFSINFWQGSSFSVCGKNSPWAVNLMLGQHKLLGKCLIVKWQGGLQIFNKFLKMCFRMHN